MSYINNEYFSNDINLTAEKINIIMSSWLDIYEEQILKSLLGYELYSLLIADTVGSTPVTQRFIDLIDGKNFSFEYAGHTINTRWMGIRIASLKKSLISYYVYYQYRNEVESFSSNVGQIKGKPENAESVSVINKLVSTWNKVVEWYGEIPEEYVYPELFLSNGDYNHWNIYPSAYNFLLANRSVYPEWVFEPLGKKNIYGI